MRTFVIVFVILAFALAALLSVPAPAVAADGDAVSEYCAANGDFGLSHGGCVAYFKAGNLAPHDASVCQDASIRGFLAVDNPGQCVKKLREMRN